MQKTIRKLVVLAAVLALVAAACGGDDSSDTTATTAGNTTTTAGATTTTAGGGTDTTAGGGEAMFTELKIGVILPLTGGIAGPGADARESWELYFDTHGDGDTITTDNGVRITYVMEDNASDPAVALTVATKLLEVDDVDIVIPGILASTGTAVGDALGDRTDVLLLSPFSCNDDFTQRAPLEGYARPAGWSCSQTGKAFAKWAYEEQGFRNIATACTDYTFGYEHCGGFADAFTQLGGTITDQIWHPLFNSDFGTYATQMNALDVDGILGLVVGGSAVPFVTAYSDFGVNTRAPLLAGVTTLDQSALRGMDKEVALGAIAHSHWSEGADNPSTQQFVADFEAATGKIASYYAAGNYGVMEWIVAATNAIDVAADWSPNLMLDTMKDDLVVQTPFGAQEMDDEGAMVFNVYINEIQEREDGKLWNVPIFTYENVDQYFGRDRDEYLAQPPYTKDFQGVGVG
ncbi:MAG: ABC transporter substrate-binding protein [Acidimicrobiia bacterium]